MSTAPQRPTRPADLRAFDAQVATWTEDLREAVAVARLTGPAAERAAAAVPLIRMQIADAQAIYDADPWARWVYQYVGNVLHRDGCKVARKSHPVPEAAGMDDADAVARALPGAHPCATCCPEASHHAKEYRPRRDSGAARTMDEFGYLAGPRRSRDAYGRSAPTKLRHGRVVTD